MPLFSLIIAKLKSQLQLQLDLASLIISSLPATHPATQPAGIVPNVTLKVNQSIPVVFTKLKMEDDLNFYVIGRRPQFFL